jgi:hypothetical protein
MYKYIYMGICTHIWISKKDSLVWIISTVFVFFAPKPQFSRILGTPGLPMFGWIQLLGSCAAKKVPSCFGKKLAQLKQI